MEEVDDDKSVTVRTGRLSYKYRHRSDAYSEMSDLSQGNVTSLPQNVCRDAHSNQDHRHFVYERAYVSPGYRRVTSPTDGRRN